MIDPDKMVPDGPPFLSDDSFIPENTDGTNKTLLQRDATSGLHVYYKEVALIAHPVVADSAINDASSVINLQKNTSGLINKRKDFSVIIEDACNSTALKFYCLCP
jgi:hypothetical protein